MRKPGTGSFNCSKITPWYVTYSYMKTGRKSLGRIFLQTFRIIVGACKRETI
jgi:hypothetical protein